MGKTWNSCITFYTFLQARKLVFHQAVGVFAMWSRTQNWKYRRITETLKSPLLGELANVEGEANNLMNLNFNKNYRMNPWISRCIIIRLVGFSSFLNSNNVLHLHIESTSHRPLHYTNTALMQPLQPPDPAGSTHYTLQCTHMHTYIPHINTRAHAHTRTA